MISHASTVLVLSASAFLAPVLSIPNPSPVPDTRPTGSWAASGWLPAHRMCEMDGPTLPNVQRWRCVRSPDRSGWELQSWIDTRTS
jgi:hypothetical protein